MKTVNKKGICLLILAVLLAVTACSPAASPSTSVAPASTSVAPASTSVAPAVTSVAPAGTATRVAVPRGGPLKAGIITMDNANSFFICVIEGFQAMQQQMGNHMQIQIFDGKGQTERQVDGVETFMNAGYQTIMCGCIDPNATIDILHQAEAQGISTATYPDLDGISVCLVWDEYNWGKSLGEEAGKWIRDHLNGEATVAFFSEVGTAAAIDRYQGIKDGVLEFNDPAKVTCLEPFNSIVADTAMDGMESILQAHPETKVVVATADSAAYGAYQAIMASGKAMDDMFIGGCDGGTESLQLIKQGTIYRTSAVSALATQELWYVVLQHAIAAQLGFPYVKGYPVPTVALTHETVDDYLNQTFKYELRSDICDYLGVTSVPIGKIIPADEWMQKYGSRDTKK